jgi:transposase
VQPTIDELLLIIKNQQAIIERLEARVTMLEQELSYYRNRKNSNNSHLPPSKDENRPLKNQSLREKSDKKPGGQPGHAGKTLEFSEQADKIILYSPCFCTDCGEDLSITPAELLARRQVIDIPPIKIERIEHQIYSKTCKCGCITKGQFPLYVKSAVQYGPNVEAVIAYMHARQYLPYNRMKEFLSDVMGLPVSEGGINTILQRFTKKALPVYLEIKERIKASAFVGTDETGAKVNGKKHWFWTWQNAELTFIVHSDNRGFKTIETTFENGLPSSVLQHDRWASHFQCVAKDHQICIAHLQRDLNYIEQLHQSQWAIQLKELLWRAMAFNKKIDYNNYLPHLPEHNKLEQDLNNLLLQPLPPSDKKAKTLQKKLLRSYSYILAFLKYPDVPPDNNGSERAIRNIKVQQKISGQFKSDKGADGFAVIRSVIDTTLKSGQNILNALRLIANWGTE